MRATGNLCRRRCRLEFRVFYGGAGSSGTVTIFGPPFTLSIVLLDGSKSICVSLCTTTSSGIRDADSAERKSRQQPSALTGARDLFSTSGGRLALSLPGAEAEAAQRTSITILAGGPMGLPPSVAGELKPPVSLAILCWPFRSAFSVE